MFPTRSFFLAQLMPSFFKMPPSLLKVYGSKFNYYLSRTILLLLESLKTLQIVISSETIGSVKEQIQ